MRVLIVRPESAARHAGNDATALRWARRLRELDHQPAIATAYRDHACDALVALHARRSAPSALAFRERHGDRPLVVALTGTDVYGDLGERDTLRALEAADRIVELQPLARLQLPDSLRGRVRTIHQSALPVPDPPPPRDDRFEVAVVGHLRPVKDPFLAAEAARALPGDSRVRILHVGAALDEAMRRRATDEDSANPRYTWLGERSREETGRILAGCRLLVLSSRSEGGANVLSEAIVNEVPVLTTRIPGTVGILGDRYPGYFPVGDDAALTALLRRTETDPDYLATLRACGRFLAARFDPAAEREAWRSLLDELDRSARGRTG